MTAPHADKDHDHGGDGHAWSLTNEGRIVTLNAVIDEDAD